MALNTLEKLYVALRDRNPDELRRREDSERKTLERMLEAGRTAGRGLGKRGFRALKYAVNGRPRLE